uniref:Uncharacterized protein n=1 Tax=Sphaerodactylus townsendi TaxID=933632 RepID=A0ACB8GEB4_9SAUR
MADPSGLPDLCLSYTSVRSHICKTLDSRNQACSGSLENYAFILATGLDLNVHLAWPFLLLRPQRLSIPALSTPFPAYLPVTFSVSSVSYLGTTTAFTPEVLGSGSHSSAEPDQGKASSVASVHHSGSEDLLGTSHEPTKESCHSEPCPPSRPDSTVSSPGHPDAPLETKREEDSGSFMEAVQQKPFRRSPSKEPPSLLILSHSSAEPDQGKASSVASVHHSGSEDLLGTSHEPTKESCHSEPCPPSRPDSTVSSPGHPDAPLETKREEDSGSFMEAVQQKPFRPTGTNITLCLSEEA